MDFLNKLIDFLSRIFGNAPSVNPKTQEPPAQTPVITAPQVKAELNPMEGFASVTIDYKKLLGFLADCKAANVRYGLGDKDPTPRSAYPIDFKLIDCSGFVRVALYYASNGTLALPDGSWIQNDWLAHHTFEGKPFKVSEYANMGLKDNRFRIGFIEPNPVGHVWLTLNGWTLESHGGTGPDSREWNHPHLANCSKVYVLSDAPKETK